MGGGRDSQLRRLLLILIW